MKTPRGKEPHDAKPTRKKPSKAGKAKAAASARPSTPPPPGTCGALTRSGTWCSKQAGWGTDHVGQGKCKLHGGATPVKHGRYSKITRPRIRELLDAFEADPDPLNLAPEVALLRALIIDYVERYDEMTEALLRWSNSFSKDYRAELESHLEAYEEHQREWAQAYHALRDLPLEKQPDPMDYPPPKPPTVIDILAVGGFITRITTITESIRKARETGTFSMATVDRLWEAMSAGLVQAAGEVISDPDQREALLDAVDTNWRTINLGALASARPAAPAEG